MTAPVQIPADPLQSPTWDEMVTNHLLGYPILFDSAVEVGLPPVTEDQSQVPITIDARKLGIVDEVVVLGDLNPFPLTLRVRPQGTPAYFAFRMRIEQGTVIRAAVRKDGQWHVGSRYLDASGGGCTAPPGVVAAEDWDNLGQMRGKIWRESADVLRVRLRIVHPMDTGLMKNPAFYIDTLRVSDANGKVLADIDVHEPIAENPTLTLLVADPKTGDHLVIAAHDIDGGTFNAKVPLLRTAEIPHSFREGRL